MYRWAAGFSRRKKKREDMAKEFEDKQKKFLKIIKSVWMVTAYHHVVANGNIT